MKIKRRYTPTQQRKYYQQLCKDIPHYQYCGLCKYKKYTPAHTDYIVGKIMRKRVWCKAIGKRNSLDDCVLSDGLKICGINYEY